MFGGPSPFVAALVVTSLVAVMFTWVGFRHRDTTGGRAFMVMMAAVALWGYADAAQLTAGDVQAFAWWGNVSFMAAVLTANAGFVFVVQYTGHGHWITRRTLALLSVEPLAIYALAWTNGDHGLVWRYTGELQTSSITWAPIENGIAFEAHLAYTYALMALLMWLLVRFYLRSRGVYRWQTLIILIGAAVPLVTNVVWLVFQSEVPQVIDPTAVTFTVTGALFTVGLRSFDLLELAPVGRYSVVRELHDAVLTVNPEDRIVDANPAARHLLARDDDPLIGKDADDVVPRYRDLLDHGGEADDVAIVVDGERRYFEIRKSPLTDATDDEVGRVVILRDVTERRRVEKRYQLFIENSTDLINVLDEDQIIRYVSPSIRNVLGYEPEDVEGTNAFGYVYPEDSEHVVEQFGELAASPGEERSVEYRMRTKSGDFRVVESRGRNLLDDPVVEGIVVNSRDITERREREDRLEQRNEQLEEFANVISHDLRNPLSVAHGYARLLEDEYDDERLGKISDAHERMEELLDDLLTLAKEGRAVSEPEPVDVEQAAHQAWAIVDTSDGTLEVDDSGEALADDTRLRQLLENMFANAVEHGSASPGEDWPNTREGDSKPSDDCGDRAAAVTIRVGTTEDGFYVADDGPGIPQEDRDRVFEAGESGADEGIGLGLTIVRRIADAHDWEVGVTRSEDGGARFEFEGVEWAGDR